MSRYPQIIYYQLRIKAFLLLPTTFPQVLYFYFHVCVQEYFSASCKILRAVEMFHSFVMEHLNRNSFVTFSKVEVTFLICWATTVSINHWFISVFNLVKTLLETLYYFSSIKIGSIPFFSSSGTYQSHHLVRCHATSINSLILSINFFLKRFAFFKFILSSQRFDMNVVLGSSKDTHFITRKRDITRIFMKIRVYCHLRIKHYEAFQSFYS